MSNELSDDGSVNRRSVLKSMGAAGAAVAGLSGAASANSDVTIHQVSSETAADTIESQATGALETLTEQSVALEANLSESDLSVSTDAGGPFVITGFSNGGIDATRTLMAKLEPAEVFVFVDLDTGDAHATHLDDDTRRIYREDTVIEAHHIPGPDQCSNTCQPVGCGNKDHAGIYTWSDNEHDCTLAHYDCGC